MGDSRVPGLRGHGQGAGGMTAKLWPDGPGRRWYRVRREGTDRPVAMLDVRLDERELVLHEPGGGLVRFPPSVALAVMTCLAVAVEQSFPGTDACGLSVEVDDGYGWQVCPPGL